MLLPNQILSYDLFGKLKQQEASFTFWSKGLELNHTKGVTPILLYAIGNYRHIYIILEITIIEQYSDVSRVLFNCLPHLLLSLLFI